MLTGESETGEHNIDIASVAGAKASIHMSQLNIHGKSFTYRVAMD